MLALPIFGFLMTWLPANYSLSPVHYGRYSSVYLFMMMSLFMFETGSLFGGYWVDIGMWLLIPGWLLALQGLWNLHLWIKPGVEFFTGVLIKLFLLNFTFLILSVLESKFGLPVLKVVLFILTLIIWGMILAVLAMFVRKDSGSAKVISV